MKEFNPAWIAPRWPAPARVRAVMTTRAGGTSPAPFDSLNLGTRAGDAIDNVLHNRARLRESLPADPRWLRQVHGTGVVDAATALGEPEADAAFARRPGVVCAALVADCMPVLICDRWGAAVAVAHAGWRGMSGGVIESTIAAMNTPPEELMAWLGPAIGPDHFEVGDDVLQAFAARDPAAMAAFTPFPSRPGKWLCDLDMLARQRLHALGVRQVHGGGFCTVGEARFFSHRRDHAKSGRMAALIWIE